MSKELTEMIEKEMELLKKESEGWLLQKVLKKEYAVLVPQAVDEGKDYPIEYYLGFDRALIKMSKLTGISNLPNTDGNKQVWALMSGYCAFKILEKLSVNRSKPNG